MNKKNMPKNWINWTSYYINFQINDINMRYNKICLCKNPDNYSG